MNKIIYIMILTVIKLSFGSCVLFAQLDNNLFVNPNNEYVKETVSRNIYDLQLYSIFGLDSTAIVSEDTLDGAPIAETLKILPQNTITNIISGEQEFDYGFLVGTVNPHRIVRITAKNNDPPSVFTTAMTSEPTPERIRDLKEIAVKLGEEDLLIILRNGRKPPVGTETFYENILGSGSPRININLLANHLRAITPDELKRTLALLNNYENE